MRYFNYFSVPFFLLFRGTIKCCRSGANPSFINNFAIIAAQLHTSSVGIVVNGGDKIGEIMKCFCMSRNSACAMITATLLQHEDRLNARTQQDMSYVPDVWIPAGFAPIWTWYSVGIVGSGCVPSVIPVHSVSMGSVGC